MCNPASPTHLHIINHGAPFSPIVFLNLNTRTVTRRSLNYQYTKINQTAVATSQVRSGEREWRANLLATPNSSNYAAPTIFRARGPWLNARQVPGNKTCLFVWFNLNLDCGGISATKSANELDKGYYEVTRSAANRGLHALGFRRERERRNYFWIGNN